MKRVFCVNLVLFLSLMLSAPAQAKMAKPSLKNLVDNASIIARVEMMSAIEPKTMSPHDQLGTAIVVKVLKGNYTRGLIEIKFSTGRPMSVPYESGEYVVFLKEGESGPYYLQGRWFGRIKIFENSLVQATAIGETDHSKKVSLELLYEKIYEIMSSTPQSHPPKSQTPKSDTKSLNNENKEENPKPEGQQLSIEQKIERIEKRIDYLEDKLDACDPESQSEDYERIDRKITRLEKMLHRAQKKKEKRKSGH